ncbi:type II toxin-antitoxin system PemK/MazF family toxin [Methanococcoides seepicolus]|uniref:Uncharacterized protein n=1 Tax=Methanococcoides seepicolus TaxID=2828780 RepID=A0A9E4ZBR8_9EURY|nr:type II toxin-antitoxin system PemK/MazF family toxin [Methanococcoides seepicolus]MCM1985716.1 hypothetical protein [Methanococcoides seepicolus]
MLPSFSDLTATKKRPALVVVDLKADDVILCPITSTHRSDGYDISLGSGDLIEFYFLLSKKTTGFNLALNQRFNGSFISSK